MENWQVVVIVLCSVLVGVCIPVLIMAGATLLSLRRQTVALGRKTDAVLDDVQVIARRIRGFTAGIEGGESSLRDVVGSLGNLGAILKHHAPIDWTNLIVSVLLPAMASVFRTLSEPPPSAEGVRLEGAPAEEKSGGPTL